MKHEEYEETGETDDTVEVDVLSVNAALGLLAELYPWGYEGDSPIEEWHPTDVSGI